MKFIFWNVFKIWIFWIFSCRNIKDWENCEECSKSFRHFDSTIVPVRWITVIKNRWAAVCSVWSHAECGGWVVIWTSSREAVFPWLEIAAHVCIVASLTTENERSIVEIICTSVKAGWTACCIILLITTAISGGTLAGGGTVWTCWTVSSCSACWRSYVTHFNY